MWHPDRVVLALVLFAAAALAACGSGPRAPAVACSGDEQCGGSAWCVEGACVGNSPPQASFVVPDPVVSGVLVALDATSSVDPDPIDQIISYVWTVDAVDAPCAAPVIADTTPTAKVRFGCAGTFAVHLVVTDTMAAASEMATRQVAVTASGAGPVRAGDDQSVQHTCAGSPLRCGLAGAVRLAGSVDASAGAALSYEWTVQPPPNRPLGATRRVRFSPGANVPDPAVEVETDGVAISGDWILHLEVRDGTRLVGADDVRLSVGNRPPAVTPHAQPSYPHAYDDAARAYRASGAVALQVSDPDGDPVARHVEWRQTGEPGDLFTGEDEESTVTFTIAVSTPSSLIGSNVRTVAITADDGNGGVTPASVPIAVGNRPPVLATTAAGAVGHYFDAATSTFETAGSATVGTWRDPDGDPLTGVDATSDPRCTGTVRSDRTASVSCSAAYAGLDTLAQLVGTHTLAIQAQDPWAAGNGTVQLTITNRPPTVGTTTHTAGIRCSPGTARDTCCQPASGTCVRYGDEYGGNTASVPLDIADPDGDPLQVSATSAQGGMSVSCSSGTCLSTFTFPVVHACTLPAPYTIEARASDGVTLASGTVSVATSCR